MVTLADNGDGIYSALMRTVQADSLLRELMFEHSRYAKGIAIFAVGGYGRCDNARRSDLDLIFIYNGSLEPHENAIRTLVQKLWDHGFSPAQTVLEMKDIEPDLLAIPDRASALLEARFIWGDSDVAHGLGLRLPALFDEKVWRQFVISKQEEYYQRRRKFGEVIRVIEPHLKSQAGGLRDLHHVFWLERARSAFAALWTVPRKQQTALTAFFRRLEKQGLLQTAEVARLLDAYDRMLRVREALHRVASRRTDLLTVDIQPAVGRELGLRGDDREVMVRLMRTVYHAMDEIARFSEETGDRLAEMSLESGNGRSKLHLRKVKTKKRRQPAENVLENIVYDPSFLVPFLDSLISSGTPLSGDLRHSLRLGIRKNLAGNIDPRKWMAALKPWFELEKGFGKRLRLLAELDAIEPWLPEWKEISGLTTGSFYHTFTVDEHTIRALEELDGLPDEGPDELPASLWRKVEKRAVIHFAVLLHDIAKGRDGDHCVTGAEIANEALARMGEDDLAESVAKLIRLHLSMEQVAFRRDASDPAVLQSFSRKVGSRELLDALYLLTVCDLRAVRRGVWTTWKGHLLAELYLATKRWFIEGEPVGEPSLSERVPGIVFHVGNRMEAENRALRFLQEMRVEYRRVVPTREIARHLEAMEEVESGKPYRWVIHRESGYCIVTLIAQDRFGLLAQVAGLLVSQGIGIRDARIFTRKDGLVIDRFRAEDIEPDGIPLDERLERIPALWDELMEGKLKLENLLDRSRRRLRFRSNHAAIIETEVKISRDSDRWFIDVSGGDSVGLLYRLCIVFADMRLHVQAARVTGRLDGIHDAFLIEDPEGLLKNDLEYQNLERRLREILGESA